MSSDQLAAMELEHRLANAEKEINRLTYELDKSRDSHVKIINQQSSEIKRLEAECAELKNELIKLRETIKSDFSLMQDLGVMQSD